MNAADVLTAILHARDKGDDPLLILAEDSPLMDDAREVLKPKAPYQSHALDEAVSKFLCWSLPRDFYPDAGVSFTPPPESSGEHWWPTGTNLFTAAQTRNMLEHVVGERIAELDATIAALREQLGDLLAIIHGDGGHYESIHGTANACEDAVAIFHGLREQLARMPVCVGYISDPESIRISRNSAHDYFYAVSTKKTEKYSNPIYIVPQPQEPKGCLI